MISDELPKTYYDKQVFCCEQGDYFRPCRGHWPGSLLASRCSGERWDRPGHMLVNTGCYPLDSHTVVKDIYEKKKRLFVVGALSGGVCLMLYGTLLSQDTGNHYSRYWTNNNKFGDVKCQVGEHMSNGRFSELKFGGINIQKREIYATVLLRDANNRAKRIGGDAVFIWAEQGDKYKIAANVKDNMDGTYTGTIRLYWEGETTIRAEIGGTKESLCVRIYNLQKYGSSLYALKPTLGLYATFKAKSHGKQSISDKTICSTEDMVYKYRTVCNFTEINKGSSWYCGHPTVNGLSCAHVQQFVYGPYPERFLPDNKPIGELLPVSGHSVINKTLTLLPTNTTRVTNNVEEHLPKCYASDVRLTWSKEFPSGYVNNNVWQTFSCQGSTFDRKETLQTCLSGKHVYFFGDSTCRQYFEYIIRELNIVTYIDTATHKIINQTKTSFKMNYKRHEMPFCGLQTNVSELTSIQEEIDNVRRSDVADDAIVMMINYDKHLQAFKPSTFRQRLKILASAVKRLIDAKPRATIFFLGPNSAIAENKWFDLRWGLLHRDIIFDEFRQLRTHVIYLDVLSITLSYGNTRLHPAGNVFKNQAEQFFSYFCRY